MLCYAMLYYFIVVILCTAIVCYAVLNNARLYCDMLFYKIL